jgi:hypothetical protein
MANGLIESGIQADYDGWYRWGECNRTEADLDADGLLRSVPVLPAPEPTPQPEAVVTLPPPSEEHLSYWRAVQRMQRDMEASMGVPVTAAPATPQPDPAEWKPCVKLPVTVHVREQRPGETHVSTREGITPVKPDDLIMRGVTGEEYPIGREIFERTYRMGATPQPVPDRLTAGPEVAAVDEVISAAHAVICGWAAGYPKDYPPAQEDKLLPNIGRLAIALDELDEIVQGMKGRRP